MTTVTTRNPVRTDHAADATAPTRPTRSTSSLVFGKRWLPHRRSAGTWAAVS
jgi:hypothetical protein